MRTYIKSNKKSQHNATDGKGKISNYLGVISSVLKGGKRVNVKSTIHSEYREMKMLSQYGIASVPYKGMQVQVIYNDDDNVMVGVYNKDIPNDLKPGDVVIFNKSQSTIKLSTDGKIIMDTGQCKLTINGSNMRIDGDVHVHGNFTQSTIY